MASRGSLGGIAKSTVFVADLMDAFGFNPIFIETVGVGQIELDIMKASDTIIVVLVPESGDSIQAMKAGLMEIGDIFLVNKADREGADRFYMDLKTTLDMGNNLRDKNWKPKIIKVSALRDIGIEDVFKAIESHRDYLLKTNKMLENRMKRYRQEFVELLKEELYKRFKENIELDKILNESFKQGKSPYEVVRLVLSK
jgi:LAO/AO transport system kinase